MKMVRIITKVVMVMARMEVMEQSALCCHIHDGLPPQMHQLINNRITLLNKRERAKFFFFFIISSSLDTGNLNPIWPGLFWCIRDLGGGAHRAAPKYLWVGEG